METGPLQNFKTLVHLTREYIQQEYGIIPTEEPTLQVVVARPIVPQAPKKEEFKPAIIEEIKVALTPQKEMTPLTPLNDIKRVIQTLFPKFPIIDEIPSDSHAKKIKESWKKVEEIPDVTLLSFQETKDESLLLESIAKALRHYGLNASVIQASKLDIELFLQTPNLKLIIADSTIRSVPPFAKHQRESVRAGSYFLGKVPLMLLPHLSLLLKDGSLKATLWKTLKQYFKI